MLGLWGGQGCALGVGIVTLPAIMVPRELVAEAKDFARDTVTRALEGVFGLIDRELERRRSYGFAVQRTLELRKLAALLRATTLRVAGKAGRIRRLLRRALRWEAKAYARDPALANACLSCLDL